MPSCSLPARPHAPGTLADMTPSHPHHTLCPVCETIQSVPILDLPGLPILANALAPDARQAREAPRGDIVLRACTLCGHVWNASFEPERLRYDADYENSLHVSPRFQRYAEELAGHLIERYALQDRDLLEIGCGAGEFLALLCERGGNRGTGFEPALAPQTRPPHPAVRFVADTYSRRHGDTPVDFILCRHVLEHVCAPRAFLCEIRIALATGGRRCPGYFEVPNLAFLAQEDSIWDLIYEHVSYFSEASLARVFHACGFEIHRMAPAYEGQFIGVEAAPLHGGNAGALPDPATIQHTLRHALRMARRLREKTLHWRHHLARARENDKRVVIWGSGSKGITFLNLMGPDSGIDSAVDLNPRKHGRHIPGTGQQVISPHHLTESAPDEVLLMNSLYREEVEQQLAHLGLTPTLLPV